MTSITLHRTDELPHDHRIAHPMLSVHLVDGTTGRPLRKSVVERRAVTSHEHIGPDALLPYHLPVMTKPFALRGARMRMPAWEEELVLGEEFVYLLHPRVFLLFELLDFSPDSPDSGLQQFAWGFLKTVSGPMADPGRANALRAMPLRLQLYRWQSRLRSPPGQPAVWTQYLAAGRTRYTSTLYVTLRALPPPDKLTVRFPFRPMAAHHDEVGRLDFASLQAATLARMPSVAPTQIVANASRSTSSNAPFTTRGGGPCLLPNAPLHALRGGEMGATAIALSPDGRFLACALAHAEVSHISVHELLSGRRLFLAHAHHRTVHELCWSADSERLLSVSGDGSAKLWQPLTHVNGSTASDDSLGEPIAVLPHPTFVFCGRMQPSSGRSRGGASLSLLVTGANDHVLRLWDASSGELLASKTQHQSRINSVAWAADGSQLFSADAAGIVRQWEVVARLGAADGADLKLTATIEKQELAGASINSIAVHPGRRRLLLQTRNSQLWGLDTRLQHFSVPCRPNLPP